MSKKNDGELTPQSAAQQGANDPSVSRPAADTSPCRGGTEEDFKTPPSLRATSPCRGGTEEDYRGEIIVIEQLPVITEQLHIIKDEVTARTQEALSLVCSEETLTAVKKERAALNKELAEWEEKRKQVKKAVLAPYEKFEGVYKECIGDIFKGADAALKNRIADVEDGLKEEKAAEVIAYYDEYSKSVLGDRLYIPFDKAGINISLSASLKALKKQAQEFIDKKYEELNLIATQENAEEIEVEYLGNGYNAALAIQSVIARRKAVEEIRRSEVTNDPSVSRPAAATSPCRGGAEEEIFTVKFTVKGTRDKLKALKEFLINGGYEYE